MEASPPPSRWDYKTKTRPKSWERISEFFRRVGIFQGLGALHSRVRSMGQRMLGNLGPTLTIAAAVTYVIVHACYDRYYQAIGLTARQVGLGYVDVLTRSFPTTAIVLFGLLYTITLASKARSPRGRMIDTFIRPLAVVALLSILVTSWFRLPSHAREILDGVKSRSEANRAMFPPDVHGLELETVGTTVPQSVEALSGACVLYLGEAEGLIAIIDTEHEVSLRIPSSLIVLINSEECSIRD